MDDHAKGTAGLEEAHEKALRQKDEKLAELETELSENIKAAFDAKSFAAQFNQGQLQAQAELQEAKDTLAQVEDENARAAEALRKELETARGKLAEVQEIQIASSDEVVDSTPAVTEEEQRALQKAQEEHGRLLAEARAAKQALGKERDVLACQLESLMLMTGAEQDDVGKFSIIWDKTAYDSVAKLVQAELKSLQDKVAPLEAQQPKSSVLGTLVKVGGGIMAGGLMVLEASTRNSQ